MKKDRRKIVAYHEAGHAVIAYRHKLEFDYVTIKPDEDSLGHVMYGKFDFDDFHENEGDITEARRRLFATLAGPYAEQKLTGIYSAVGTTDHQMVIDFAGLMVLDERALEKFLEYATLEMELIFGGENNAIWRQVERLANALLEKETLSFQEVGKIIWDIP